MASSSVLTSSGIDKLAFGGIMILSRIPLYVEQSIFLSEIDCVSVVKQYHMFMFALPA